MADQIPLKRALELVEFEFGPEGWRTKWRIPITEKIIPEPAIEPVPVDERLPGAEDCDGENQCWQWDPKSDAWVLYTSVGLRLRADVAPYWLPHRALPVPQDS
jgi:hypothetical protein